MPRKSNKEQATPWPIVLSEDERRLRMNDIYFHLKNARITNNAQVARDLNICQETVGRYMQDPPLEFALKYAYLYGADILEMYPELVWLRDHWLKEFQQHLDLIESAAEIQNPDMIRELIKVCRDGLAVYLNPELLVNVRKIQGKALKNIQELKAQGEKRRKRDKPYRAARYKLNAHS